MEPPALVMPCHDVQEPMTLSEHVKHGQLVGCCQEQAETWPQLGPAEDMLYARHYQDMSHSCGVFHVAAATQTFLLTDML
jgi:hypothetical protein